MKTPATATLPVAFVPVDASIPCRGELIDIGMGLGEMKDLIGCDLVERVCTSLLAIEGAEMWVDEEGSCRRGSRRNLRASMIAGVTIYGNAIITGRDLTSLRMDCPKAFFDNVQTLAEAWMAKHNEK